MIRLTVSGQDGRTSYRTSTPGRGSIFNIEKTNNSQKIEKDSDNYFASRESEDEIKKEEKKEFIENVNIISAISNYRVKSLLSIKNTDLTSYSPYLCVRSDGQISFENISNENDGYSFTFCLRIIPIVMPIVFQYIFQCRFAIYFCATNELLAS